MTECCCQPYDPDRKVIVRCWPRALDLGHCFDDGQPRGGQIPDYCCKSPKREQAEE